MSCRWLIGLQFSTIILELLISFFLSGIGDASGKFSICVYSIKNWLSFCRLLCIRRLFLTRIIRFSSSLSKLNFFILSRTSIGRVYIFWFLTICKNHASVLYISKQGYEYICLAVIFLMNSTASWLTLRHNGWVKLK